MSEKILDEIIEQKEIKEKGLEKKKKGSSRPLLLS